MDQTMMWGDKERVVRTQSTISIFRAERKSTTAVERPNMGWIMWHFLFLSFWLYGSIFKELDLHKASKLGKMTKDDKTAKDEPAADAKTNPELNISKGKIKKNKKKKKHTNKSESSVSSGSASEVNTALAPPLVIDEPAREQYFDAHESYHGLPAPVEDQLVLSPAAPAINPLAANAVPALVPSEAAGKDLPLAPKDVPAPALAPSLTPVAPAAGTALLVARSEHGQEPKISAPGSVQEQGAKKEPSTISKPVTGPQ